MQQRTRNVECFNACFYMHKPMYIYIPIYPERCDVTIICEQTPPGGAALLGCRASAAMRP
jgi:hypothetical protein